MKPTTTRVEAYIRSLHYLSPVDVSRMVEQVGLEILARARRAGDIGLSGPQVSDHDANRQLLELELLLGARAPVRDHRPLYANYCPSTVLTENAPASLN